RTKNSRLLLIQTKRRNSQMSIGGADIPVCPVKRSDSEPFFVRQLDDNGALFEINHHLDVRGLTCPMPALKSLERSVALASGEVLEIVGDWPGSKFEVPYAITSKPD